MAENKNEPVMVMNGKRFVAAYSARPFLEGMIETGAIIKTLKWSGEKEIPDYKLYQEKDGTYWCVRIGDIDVPWGFDSSVNGYWANGVVTVSRMNVGSEPFDGRGFPFVREGDVFYLYECELGDNGFYGFSIYMRGQLLNSLRKLAKGMTKEDFETKLSKDGANELKNLPEVQELLKEHRLDVKQVILHGIGEDKKEE